MQIRLLLLSLCIFRAAVKLIEDESDLPYTPCPNTCNPFLLLLIDQSSTFIIIDEPVLPLIAVLVTFCCYDKIS